MKLQAPTSKLQRSTNIQPPIIRPRGFEVWGLEFLWSLVLGIWDFVPHESRPIQQSSAPAGLVDLASARIGGIALLANDEFFAEKENLLKPGRGIFIPDKYTDRGKWMDGWETRRRRTPGHDWCVVQLGLRGIIKQVDIDTNHFLGNHPPFASLDALCLTNCLPERDRCSRRRFPGRRSLQNLR